MKKIFGAFSIALLAFSSCQKNENPSPAEDCTVLTILTGRREYNIGQTDLLSVERGDVC